MPTDDRFDARADRRDRAPPRQADRLSTSHGIVPERVNKRIKDIIDGEKLMLDCARNLEFEKAAAARDELFRLREQVFGAARHDEERDGTT
jgi:excinuclease UvrABC helicase subunit UvrB